MDVAKVFGILRLIHLANLVLALGLPRRYGSQPS
jgi:hypothetical protein